MACGFILNSTKKAIYNLYKMTNIKSLCNNWGFKIHLYIEIGFKEGIMKDFKNDIRLARQGDTDAFARLYTIIYKQMYYTALYNLRSEFDACDAVSETVIDAFANIKNLKSEEAFKSWIMKILFTKIKKKQREYVNYEVEISENTETISFDYEKSELNEVLNGLDNESKAILSLSVLGGYNSKEISKIFGIKSSTVRSKLLRIKEKLRIDLT